MWHSLSKLKQGRDSATGLFCSIPVPCSHLGAADPNAENIQPGNSEDLAGLVWWTLYILHITQITLYITQITLHITQITLHITQITLHITQITLHSAQISKAHTNVQVYMFKYLGNQRRNSK